MVTADKTTVQYPNQDIHTDTVKVQNISNITKIPRSFIFTATSPFLPPSWQPH